MPLTEERPRRRCVHRYARYSRLSLPVIPAIGRSVRVNYEQEKAYLAAACDTLHDFAVLSPDTGVRAGEGTSLAWEDVARCRSRRTARLRSHPEREVAQRETHFVDNAPRAEHARQSAPLPAQ